MARVRGFGLADRSVVRRTTLRVCVVALAGWGAVASIAQDEAPTLHVYTDLIQVPVLVLGQNRKPTSPIEEGRFFVSLDRGPRFRVTHARLEGDDPISLAILLDLDQPDPRLIGKIDNAIAGLAPEYLRPKDHVWVYAADCGLIRSTDDGATDSATLKQQVDVALKAWKDRAWTRAKDCKTPSHLADSLIAVTRALAMQPGRRVLLVETDGVDRGSKYPMNGAGELAQQSGVAIFGLIRPEDRWITTGVALTLLCEQTGGMVMVATEKSLVEQLEQFTGLVRGRYILEFPRPVNTKPGYYGMQITIRNSNAFIRPSGIGVPVYDPAILKNPTTVPLDPSSSPRLGKSRLPAPN